MALCRLEGWEKDTPKACECIKHKCAKHGVLVNTSSMDAKISGVFFFNFAIIQFDKRVSSECSAESLLSLQTTFTVLLTTNLTTFNRTAKCLI